MFAGVIVTVDIIEVAFSLEEVEEAFVIEVVIISDVVGRMLIADEFDAFGTLALGIIFSIVWIFDMDAIVVSVIDTL